jgi:hypothetical protein
MRLQRQNVGGSARQPWQVSCDPARCPGAGMMADGESWNPRETKPNEAKWVKSSIVKKMSKKFRKRSQMTYSPCFQRITANSGPFLEKNECAQAIPPRNSKTNPNEANHVKSSILSKMSKKFRKRSQTAYLPRFQRLAEILGPFFGKNKCAGPIPCGDPKTKPNKAKWVKPCVLSEMSKKFRKQSQMTYLQAFQSFTDENGLIFGKNECPFVGGRLAVPSRQPTRVGQAVPLRLVSEAL